MQFMVTVSENSQCLNRIWFQSVLICKDIMIVDMSICIKAFTEVMLMTVCKRLIEIPRNKLFCIKDVSLFVTLTVNHSSHDFITYFPPCWLIVYRIVTVKLPVHKKAKSDRSSQLRLSISHDRLFSRPVNIYFGKDYVYFFILLKYNWANDMLSNASRDALGQLDRLSRIYLCKKSSFFIKCHMRGSILISNRI